MCWCCQSRYLLLWSTIACFWNHILVERLINAMLVVLLPKLWFWIENRDWHKCFWMSSWGSPLLDPKKLQNQQFYIIDWIRKKTPGQSCQSGYLLPWWLWCTIGSLGTLRKCYVSSRLGLTTFPPTRARALAENNSARPEDFDPKTGTETCQLFLGQCVKKVAMHSPGKRRYKVDMLVDTWNGSPRHVCSQECPNFIYDALFQGVGTLFSARFAINAVWKQGLEVQCVLFRTKLGHVSKLEFKNNEQQMSSTCATSSRMLVHFFYPLPGECQTLGGRKQRLC